MNIILVGFMGVGKTTIGRKLAVRLGYRFIDTDYQIEREQNCRIAEIFTHQGEAYFRDLETSLLKRLRCVQNTVIATGGGILTTPGNIEIMKAIGTSIHLNADIDQVFERVSRNTKRPLLQTADPLKTLTEMYEARKTIYAQADICINTNELKMWHIVSKIIQVISEQASTSP